MTVTESLGILKIVLYCRIIPIFNSVESSEWNRKQLLTEICIGIKEKTKGRTRMNTFVEA